MFQGCILPHRPTKFPLRFVGLGLCLSFTLFFFWHFPPASLLFLLLAAWLAWLRLEGAVALLPLTFPFYLDLLPLTPSGSVSFSLTELGLMICLGVALLRNVFRFQEREDTRAWLRRLWRHARMYLLPAGVFVFGASLAVLVSPDRHESLRAYREEVIEPLLYFLLLSRYVRTRDDVIRVLGAFIGAAVLAAVLGIIQGVFHITADLLVINAMTFRVNGPYGSPNNLAFLVSRTLPILLALALLGMRRTSAGGDVSRIRPWCEPLRWLCLVAMVPLVWALYWTGSRGAEVALLVLLCVFFVFEMRWWIAVLAVAGAGALGVALFWSRLVGFLGEAGHGLISERLLLWKAALLMIRDHPFLGTGLDSFNVLYRPTAPHSYALQALDGQPFPLSYNPNLSHPHDFFLDFWISTGLLGVAALFWLLKAFVTTLIRTYRACAALRQGSVLQRLLLGLGGSMLVSFVHGLVDNSYFVPDLAMVFWLLLGMTVIIQGMVQRERLILL